jgi:hypothetical protein
MKNLVIEKIIMARMGTTQGYPTKVKETIICAWRQKIKEHMRGEILSDF